MGNILFNILIKKLFLSWISVPDTVMAQCVSGFHYFS